MLPYLFEVGRFGLPTYGVMAALGLLAGLWVVVRLARRAGLDPDHAWNLGILAILSAIVGAKLLLVVTDWGHYGSLSVIFSLGFLQAGGVFYGGLLGALLACTLYVRRYGLPVLKTADVFAPGIALGHGIGRLGCFAAGCCYGRMTDLPWAVTFTNPTASALVGTPLNVPLHPTQVYEFLVEMVNFGILMWLFRRKSFDGQVMGAYLFLYGFARYFLEFVRDDPERGDFFGIMTMTQFISILLVMAGGALWVYRGGRARAAGAR
jgi:phosphatidylglycerol:prolipoprotein diacylglycerol transferase